MNIRNVVNLEKQLLIVRIIIVTAIVILKRNFIS